MPAAGKLRHRITIQQSSEGSPDDYGETTPIWADLDVVWAEKLWLSGRELERAASVSPEARLKFRIRYRDDVTPNMRVKHNNNYYYIGASLPDERESDYLDLFCRTEL